MAHMTEADVRRLQHKVDRMRDKKKAGKEPPGLYDRVAALEKKVKEHETRLDYMMARLLKGGL